MVIKVIIKLRIAEIMTMMPRQQQLFRSLVVKMESEPILRPRSPRRSRCLTGLMMILTMTKKRNSTIVRRIVMMKILVKMITSKLDSQMNERDIRKINLRKVNLKILEMICNF